MWKKLWFVITNQDTIENANKFTLLNIEQMCSVIVLLGYEPFPATPLKLVDDPWKQFWILDYHATKVRNYLKSLGEHRVNRI